MKLNVLLRNHAEFPQLMEIDGTCCVVQAGLCSWLQLLWANHSFMQQHSPDSSCSNRVLLHQLVLTSLPPPLTHRDLAPLPL